MALISTTVLESYQVRKTKKQKTDFIQYVDQFAKERGYECVVEKGALGARNIVVGSPDTAEVIYTAHYDTCPVLPFPNFITPKKIGWYLLYQLLIVIAAMAILFAVGGVCGFLIGYLITLIPEENASLLLQIGGPSVGIVCWVSLFVLLFAGPANRHTANDNTSGVITLLTIMDTLPICDREKVAFVFFDMEETGLFGSAGFASKHKRITAEKLLINFDCVSDGKHILLAVQKKGTQYVPLLEQVFVGNDQFSVEIRSKGVFYPSDQMNFKCGVGVASLKYSKRLKTEYMDRIHTKRDVILEEDNILFLSDCAVNLAGRLNHPM